MRGVHGSFLDKDSVSVSDSASDSFFHMLKWGYFWGGGGCSAFAQGKGHWIGLSCGELQTPHPKGALPLEISLLFIWITGAEMRKGGLNELQVAGHVQTITAGLQRAAPGLLYYCMPLPSILSVRLHRTLKSLEDWCFDAQHTWCP